jgi:putative transposase
LAVAALHTNSSDNAKAESFMKTLKCEQVYLSEYDSLAGANAQIGHFLEAVYNQKHLHSNLGYLPPAEFEQPYNKDRDKNRTITP